MKFIQPLEELRVSTLRGYNILGTSSEEEFDNISELAAKVCNTSSAVITLLDNETQWIKSSYNFDTEHGPKNLSFCQYTIQGNTLFEVNDTLLDARFCNNPVVTGEPHIRYYAGYPLIDPMGFRLGALAVIHTQPFAIQGNQKDALRILAGIVVGKIVTRRRQEEQSQFERIFVLSNDLMSVVDKDGILRKVNPAFKSLLGWDEEEMVGVHANTFSHPNDRIGIEENITDIYDGNRAINVSVTRVLKKNGEYMYVEWVTSMEEATGLLYCVGRNVDLQIKYEQKLKNVNDFYEQTGIVSDIGGWEINLATEEVRWQQRVFEIHEVDESFVPDYSTSVTFFKGDQLQKVNEAFMQTLETGELNEVEARLVTGKGNERWVRILILVDKEDDHAIRLYGTIQNIDARKRAEITYQKTKDLLDNILKSASSVCIIATDSEGVITVFNSGAENLTGYTAIEMIGKKTPLVLHRKDEIEAYRKSLGWLYDKDFDAFEAFLYETMVKGVVKRELTFVRKDGSEFTGSIMLTLIRNAENQVTGMLGITTDVTEQQETVRLLAVERSRLEAFVEHAPVAIAMYDHELRYITTSRKSRDMYSLENKDIIGVPVYNVFPELQEIFKDVTEDVLAGKTVNVMRDDFIFPGKTEQRVVSWTVRPWYNPDTSLGGVIVFTDDITESVEQQRKLQMAQKLAEDASRAKSDFLAGMSHEIRTPLNGIIGFTDLLLKTELDKIQRQYLEIVNQSGTSLLDIINDILDFSKIEAKKLEIEQTEFDLLELARQSVNIISYQAQKNNLEILLDLQPDLPRFVVGDSVRIRQVIINLLSNAVKFTQRGEIKLKISLLRTNNEKAHIKFEVKDTGIGIHRNRQSAIFSAFTQEDSSTTRKFGGTGLGLSISASLLNLMGSEIKLKSKPGQGSTFFFEMELPYRADQNEVFDNLACIKSALIAMDNEAARGLAQDMLAQRNINVVEVSNGLEALSAIAKGARFDLILLDSEMPFLDGVETCLKIRSVLSIHEQPFIILLHNTGNGIGDSDLIDFSEADLQLHKPLQANVLFSELSKMIDEKDEDEVCNGGEESDFRKELVIIIAEDNAVNMLLSKTIVARALPLAKIYEAKNGLEAIELFNSHSPDLILMDIQMPEMNGYEATETIRKKNALVPIIALTASSIMGDQEKCLEAGMNDFLMKPFVEKALIQILAKWIHKRK